MLIDIFKKGLYFEEPNDGSGGAVQAEQATVASPTPAEQTTTEQTQPEQTAKQEPVADTNKQDKEVKRLTNALKNMQVSKANLESQLEQFNRNTPEIKSIDEHPALKGVAVDADGYVPLNGVPVPKEFYVAQIELQEQQQNILNFQRQQIESQYLAETNRANTEILESTVNFALELRKDSLPLEGEAAKAADAFVVQQTSAIISDNLARGSDLTEALLTESAKTVVANLRMIADGLVSKQTESNKDFENRYQGVNNKGALSGSAAPPNYDTLSRAEKEAVNIAAAKQAMAARQNT
jgi:hypothetical protein